MVLEVLVGGINPTPHQNKTILIGKKELNLFLFTDDRILYGGIPKK